MMRLIVALLVLVCAWPSHAATQFITSTDDGNTYYIDLSTRVVSGRFVRVEELRNFDDPHSGGKGAYSSQVWDSEYDCGRKMLRWHKVTTYRSAFGMGPIISSKQYLSEWFPIKDGSIGKSLLAAACTKRWRSHFSTR